MKCPRCIASRSTGWVPEALHIGECIVATGSVPRNAVSDLWQCPQCRAKFETHTPFIIHEPDDGGWPQ